MRKDRRGGLLRAFRLMAIAVALVMLTQPETWMLAVYFLDASMLDVLAVLLQVQIAVVLAPVMQHVLWPVWARAKGWLAERRTAGCGRAVSAAARSFVVEWSGPLGAVLWLWAHERSREFCRAH